MLQLQIEHCRREDVEQLGEALENTAALYITLTDKHDDPILEPELGTTPLWPHVVIHALYASEQDAEQAMITLLTTHPHLDYTLQPVPDNDWERVCMDNFKPQQFGERLWVCPSWLTPPDPGAVNLILDPGLAFGTGTHPTTALCLSWLEQAHLNGQTIIDYGCGSGILALAALKLGATHAMAVDIDEQALLATRNNAATNNLAEKTLTVDFPDALASASADIIIANILLTPLITLEQRFHHYLKPNGTLVVSGLLDTQASDLLSAYQTHFKHEATHTKEGWALLVFTRKTA